MPWVPAGPGLPAVSVPGLGEPLAGIGTSTTSPVGEQSLLGLQGAGSALFLPSWDDEGWQKDSPFGVCREDPWE